VAAQALDVEIDFADFALQGTDRWKLAGIEADLSFPHAAGVFSFAINAPVTPQDTPQDTPRLYRMLQRVMAGAGASTHTAKDRYRRVHAQPRADLFSSRRQRAEVKRLLSVRAYGDRLGVGACP
jgi:hypothetical protein